MFIKKEQNVLMMFYVVIYSGGGVDCNFTYRAQSLKNVEQQTGERFSAVSLAWAKTSLLKTEICAYAFVT